MVKDERKTKKAASAARASQMLGQSASPAPMGFGFGGYVGSQNLSSAFGGGGDDSSGLPVLDPELQLHVKRLSKKDTTTTLRALQNLTEIVGNQPDDQIQLLLPIWANIYPRFATDNARSVREGSAKFQKALSEASGKNLAPFLKQLLGPWFLQKHDLYTEVAKCANLGLKSVFQGPKLVDALQFCSTQIVNYLLGLLNSTPEALGDSQRETPEELQERYERTVSSSLRSLTSLLGEEKLDGTHTKILEVLNQPGFWKKFSASKSNLIRRETFNFIAVLVKSNEEQMRQDAQQYAPKVLSALSEKDSGNHRNMWDMILSFCKAFPESFENVNFQKATLPALLSFLRHGCYGSGNISYPAIYPFLTCIPSDLLISQDKVMEDILSSILEGVQKHTSSQRQSKDAEACFLECLKFFLSKVEGSQNKRQESLITQVSVKLVNIAFSKDTNLRALGCNLLIQTLEAFSKLSGLSSEESQLSNITILGHIRSLLEDKLNGELKQKLENGSGGEQRTESKNEKMGHILDAFDTLGSFMKEKSVLIKMRSHIGQPLLKFLMKIDKEGTLDQKIPLIVSIMQSFQTAPENAEELIAQAVQNLSEKLRGNEPIQDSTWTQFLSTQILGGDSPGLILLEVLNIMDNQNIEPEITGKLIDSLWQNLNEDSQARQVKNPERRNQADDAGKILLEETLKGNVSSAKVLGNLLSKDIESLELSQECSKSIVQSITEQFSNSDKDNQVSVTRAIWFCVKGFLTSKNSWESASFLHHHASQRGNSDQLLLTENGSLYPNLGVSLVCKLLEYSCVHSQVQEEAERLWSNGRLLYTIGSFLSDNSEAEISQSEQNGQTNKEDLALALSKTLVKLVGQYLNSEAFSQRKKLAERCAEYQKWIHDGKIAGQHYFIITETALRNAESNSSNRNEWWIISSETHEEGHKLNPKEIACQFLIDTYRHAGFQASFESSRSSERTHQVHLLESLLCTTAQGSEEFGDIHEALYKGLIDSNQHALIHQVIQRLRDFDANSQNLSVKGRALTEFLQGLLKLLPSQIACSIFSPVLHQWLNNFDGFFHGKVFAEAFSSLVSIFRSECEQGSQSPELELLSQSTAPRILEARKKAPLWRTLEIGSNQRAEILDKLEVILAFFPCELSTKKGPTSSESEKTELLALCEVCMASQEGLKRQQILAGSSNNTLGTNIDREILQRVSSIYVRLLSVALLYASSEISESYRKRVCEHIRDSIQNIVVTLEETSEALGQTAREIINNLHSEEQDIKASFETLKQLTIQLDGLALKEFKVKLAPISEKFSRREEILEDEAYFKDSLTSVSIFLKHIQVSNLPAWAKPLASDILRCVLAIGSCCSIGLMGDSFDELSDWLEDLEPILEPLSLCASILCSSPSSLIFEAGHAMNEWASETGVDCVGACLGILGSQALLPESCHGLLAFSLKLLLESEFLSTLCKNLEDEDEEELAEYQANAEERGKSSQILVAYGLRSDISLLLEGHLYLKGHLGEDSENEIEDEDLLSAVGSGWYNMLLWAILLNLVLDLPAESAERQSISRGLQTTSGLLSRFLDFLGDLLPLLESIKSSSKSPQKLEPREAVLQAAQNRSQGIKAYKSPSQRLKKSLLSALDLQPNSIAVPIFSAALRAFPASVRSWYQSIPDKKLAKDLEAYTIAQESSRIILEELAGVSGNVTQSEAEDGALIEMGAKAKLGRREAVAQVNLEGETILELSIQLPECWPLDGAKVECRKGIGVAESRRRKWILDITAMLRSQNAALSDAISLWQKNCARQFAGVEECLICYNVILAGTAQLPKLSCKTCTKRFHSSCLYKWFRTSHKSVCPHCQSPW